MAQKATEVLLHASSAKEIDSVRCLRGARQVVHGLSLLCVLVMMINSRTVWLLETK